MILTSMNDINLQEVAVKKFLDQEFYGDALDEFRSEVCYSSILHVIYV
jgi:hypothetical protein